MTKNYGFTVQLGMAAVFALLIGIPILIFGLAATIKFIQLIFFTPITSGSIPVWSIFVIGLAILIIKRRSR